MTELNNLPNGFIRVNNPDHPFTYDGPDTLLSDKKALLAIFNIRDNEYKNPNKLFTRLTNSLIAYPAHTKMLLLFDHTQNIPDVINHYAMYYFSDIIESNDIKKIKLLTRDNKAENKIKEIKKIQKKIFQTQAIIQQDNIHYIKKTEFTKKEILDIPNLKNKAKYYDKTSQKLVQSRAKIFEYENQFFGLKKLNKNVSDIIELQPFFEFVINSEFIVDNGVPYFNSITRKALNLNEVPKIKFDPLKPTRIASLFGWHIVNSNDFQQIEERIIKFKI
ncbi:hypothetical protein AAFH68_19100 [Flavobacterium sp. CGRL1]